MIQTTLSSWVFVGLLLCITPTEAYGLASASFPENVVVAIMHDADPVTLTCDSKTLGTITWRFEGLGLIEDVVLGNDFQQEGSHLKVSYVDTPMVGEYSCWSGETKLTSAYLMLAAEGMNSDSLLSCRATSYNCVFNCYWNHPSYTATTTGTTRAVRLGLGHDCAEGRKNCSWVSPSSRFPNGGLQFVMSHFLTPYAEENKMLEVTAEAIGDYLFQRATKRFYLRDIIKPESPQIRRCQETGDELNVTIEPASSWSTPHSFFRLEHQIQYEYRDNGQKENSTCNLIPKAISRLRVQSRDALVHSAWSEWTTWANVNHSEC